MATPEKSDEATETDVVEVEEDLNETETEETETDETSGDEETEEGEVRELEPWEETGEEPETLPDVPVATHIKAKDKWKRQKSTLITESEAKDAKIAELEAKLEVTPQPALSELKRPDPLDFDDDEDYQDAYENYIIDKSKSADRQKNEASKEQAFKDSIADGVSLHNERVGNFIEAKGVAKTVYDNRDRIFIDAFEKVYPGQGEANADFMLSNLGEGSEKVPYFLGGNPKKLAEFVSLLEKDPRTGFAAYGFLVNENARLRGVTSGKPKTKAPAPAANATGDISTAPGTVKDSRLKKQYDAAHAKNDDDAAWEIRKKAKAAGVDIKSW